MRGVLSAAEGFDLITSLHSWYLIDPIYLIKAYRKLAKRGIFLVTLGPVERAGNFVNAMTVAIDDVLAQRLRHGKKHDECYEMKCIGADPYRNYAEDIEVAFDEFFGRRDGKHDKAPDEQVRNSPVFETAGPEIRNSSTAKLGMTGPRTASTRRLAADDGFGLDPINDQWIDSSEILEANGLTEKGKLIVNFFLHGKFKQIDMDEIYARVYADLAQLVCDGKLPACEWDFALSKSDILLRGRSELRISVDAG